MTLRRRGKHRKQKKIEEKGGKGRRKEQDRKEGRSSSMWVHAEWRGGT